MRYIPIKKCTKTYSLAFRYNFHSKCNFLLVFSTTLLVAIVVLYKARFQSLSKRSKESKNITITNHKKVIITHYKSLWRGFRLQTDKCGNRFDCEIIYDATDEQIKNSDVFIMHPVFTELENSKQLDKSKEIISNLNKLRKPNQLYIFQQSESPEWHTPDYTIFNNFFNATLTYRSDSEFLSDLTIPEAKLQAYYKYRKQYGNFDDPKSDATDFEITEFFQQSLEKFSKLKSKGVLAIISNCRSNYRNDIVKGLRNLIKFPDGTSGIDTVGKCFDKKLPGGWSSTVSKSLHYKFYIAIENSRCKDYITEKFFNNALLAGSVPIVAGAPRKDYEKKAPGHSFIHVDDFDNLEGLADWINYLLKNETAYNNYHKWRTNDNRPLYWPNSLENLQSDVGICKICRVANSIKLGRSKQKFPVFGLEKWWYGDEQKACKPVRGDEYNKWKQKSSFFE